jgi:hypothetical protein
MVAPGLGPETGFPGRRRFAIRRYPVAELGAFTHKLTAALGSVVPLVVPDAFNQQPHLDSSNAISHLPAGCMVPVQLPVKRQPVALCMARRQGDDGKALNWFWDYLSQPGYFSNWLDSS